MKKSIFKIKTQNVSVITKTVQNQIKGGIGEQSQAYTDNDEDGLD